MAGKDRDPNSERFDNDTSPLAAPAGVAATLASTALSVRIIALIEAGEIDRMYELLDQATSLSKTVALKLLDVNKYHIVVNFLGKFNDLDADVALKLIDESKGQAVVENSEIFLGLVLDNNIALRLLDKSAAHCLAKNLGKFQDLHKDVALRLSALHYGLYGREISQNLGIFTGLDREAALVMVVNHFLTRSVLKNPGRFTGFVPDKEVAQKLFEVDSEMSVAENLDKFQDLDLEIAMTLFNKDCAENVVKNAGKFTGLVLDRTLALKLLGTPSLKYVLKNREKFEGFSLDTDAALELLNTAPGIKTLVENLSKFQGLSKDVAIKMIHLNLGKSVAQNLNLFHGLNSDVAHALISVGQWVEVVRNMKNFQGFEINKETAQLLIPLRAGLYLAERIEELKWPRSEFSDESLFAKCKKHLRQIIGSNVIPCFTEEDWAFYVSRDAEEKGFQSYRIIDLNELRRCYAKLSDVNLSAENTPSVFQQFLDQQSDISEWKNIQLLESFKKGIECFGYAPMFKFLKNSDLHDAVYAFDRVMTLQTKSGLGVQEFYGNILHQVSLDTSIYGVKSAHQLLNDITAAFEIQQLEDIYKEISMVEGFPEINLFLKQIGCVNDIFKNWKTLVVFYQLSEIIKNKELIESLKTEPNQELKKYVSTLLLHPTIANKAAVELFWKDPRKFYDLPASHTPAAVQNRKKPSNYLDVPSMQWEPTELRNALVEGSLDDIQAFRPIIIDYEVPGDIEFYKQAQNKPLIELITEALGKRERNNGKTEYVGALADQPAQLIKELEKYLRKHGVNLRTFIGWLKDDVKIVSPAIEAAVRSIVIKNPNYTKKFKSEYYRARIFLKSDPEGVVAGNDTACCMPFGDGKNTVYTFNPACAQFVIQKKNDANDYRTIAQSVLTKDRDIGVNVGELREYVVTQGDTTSLHEKVPAELLAKSKFTLACDSLEVTPNYKSEKSIVLIKRLYQDALGEYLRQYDPEGEFNHDRIVVGMFNEDVLRLDTAPNTFLPVSPVSYSDKYGKQVLTIDLTDQSEDSFFEKKVTIFDQPEKHVDEVEKPKRRVVDLTYEDTLQMSYLEGKIYSGTGLFEGLHDMQNMLIAKDILNSRRKLPNMSLKYLDDKESMAGYLLAYEGALPVSIGSPQKEPCIYIADLAANPNNLRAGGELMIEFMNRYIDNYANSGNLLPLFAQMRESTSYALVTKNLKRLAAKAGLEATIEKIDTKTVGENTMHNVIIRFKKI